MSSRSTPTLREVRGILRSLRLYYGDPRQIGRMTRFYRQFLQPGDLAFDVGAHVGSRTLAWWCLGARVVAVEPVPQAAAVLRLLFGRSKRVTVVQAALDSREGTAALLVSEREPTVSTLSFDWAQRMERERRAFARTRWERSVEVPATTLDALIDRFGEPAFCKIDVEGADLAVLRGLSRPLPALSFEYVPPALDLALECLAHVRDVASYEFNWSQGESMRFAWPAWVSAESLAEHLRSLPEQGNPGDIYARRMRGGNTSTSTPAA